MLIIGLTGGIGMGKSFVAREFSRLGFSIFDADKEVHGMFSSDKNSIEKIKKEFPESFVKERIDRKKLGELAISDPAKIKKLEKIIHPLVRKKELDFIKKMRAAGKKFVLLDIPLLFETGFDKFCDYVVVVHAPLFIQRRRLLKRGKMTEAQFNSIIKKQMPAKEKKKLADFVINTGLEKSVAIKQVREVFRKIKRN